MANTIYTMEAANLFCGDADPANSKHLTLEDLTLPDLQAMYADHHPGGSFVAMEMEVGVSKLTSTFKLKGWDPALIAQFGIGTQLKNKYTAYGMVRDKRTGRAFEAKAVLEGRIGKAGADTFTRGNSMGFQYSINEITSYQLYFDGDELVFWDFWTNTYRMGGVDQNADLNRILRVPNVAG